MSSVRSKLVLARNYAVYRQHDFWAATRRASFPLDPSSDFVISVASYPKRIHLVPAVFESLARQTVKPRHAYLVLSAEDYPDRSVPRGIRKLSELGVEIVWTENNPFAVKKLVPILNMRVGLGVVTLDDDMIYAPHTVARVVRLDRTEQPRVVGQIGHQLFRRGRRLSMFYREPIAASLTTPSPEIYLQGCGTYYTTGSLHQSVTNLDAITRIVPGRGSDIWFWAAATAAGSMHFCVGSPKRSGESRTWTPIPQSNLTQPRDRPGAEVLEQRFQMAIDFFGIREKLLDELPDRGEDGQAPE